MKRTRQGVDALFPQIRKRILAALLMQPDRTWFASDLARHLRVPKTSLQRELANLHSAGIIQRRVEGRHVYYKAETQNPLFPELQGLMAKTAGLVDVVRQSLRPLGKRIDFAFIYGSVARAEEGPTSDVDLVVVGNVGLSDLALLLRKAARTLSREVNPSVYTRDEFKRRASGESFVSALLDRERLFVVGTENDLEEALGRTTGRARAGPRRGARQASSGGGAKPR
jgi:predicted nucleotidyltransferase